MSERAWQKDVMRQAKKTNISPIVAWELFKLSGPAKYSENLAKLERQERILVIENGGTVEYTEHKLFERAKEKWKEKNKILYLME